MVRIYLQYSYGGFKTFLVEGKENEAVCQEVTASDTLGFPQDARYYFQYGGAKMVYRYLDDGSLDLAVRDIPSIHKDSDGRSIPCAVQFIGEKSDREWLDHLATSIATDISKFHEFFSHLFRVREGLRIDGLALREWLDGHNSPFVCNSPSPQINNIPHVKAGVILFVPLSRKFGTDETVTRNVASELHLPIKQMRFDNCVLSIDAFLDAQGEGTVATGASTVKREIGKEVAAATVDELKAEISQKEAEIAKLREQADANFQELKKVSQELSELQRANLVLTEQLAKNKKNLYIAAGTAAVLASYGLYSLISK